MKIGNMFTYRGYDICKNFGGYVIVDSTSKVSPEFTWFIYKTQADARNAIRKFLDGTNTAKPRTIRKMTEDEFINAFTF